MTPEQALLAFYGPYLEQGKPSSEGDRKFDEAIRKRDDRFGLRDVEEVQKLASAVGFELRERHRMPSNNWLMVYSRKPL
jgi:hypothetical protein